MSIEATRYVIAGYDLTNRVTDMDAFSEWYWQEEAEKWWCDQRKGEIQLFYDGMNGDYIYFGYIISEADEYGNNDTDMFSFSDIEHWQKNVYAKLLQLQEEAKILNASKGDIQYRVICFTQYT